jgi:NADH-quinone oxidoreductase subunit J
MYGVEFVGLLFIMVYVGAIAVLFLFVIMMINTKTKNKTFWELNDIPIIITFSGILLTNIYVNFNEIFSKHPYLSEKHYFNFEYIPLDNISNLESIGQVLFNHYYMAVFIAGLILLVALIGGIKLTIEFKKSKDTSNQNNKQLSKNKESTHSFQ